MEHLQIRMPAELKLELKIYAAKNKLHLTGIVISLIANHIGRSDLVPAKWKPRNPEGEGATHADGE